MLRNRRLAAAAVLTAAAGLLAGAAVDSTPATASAPAAAARTAGSTLRAVPVRWTPRVVSPKSTVRQLVQCGRTVYAVGNFTTIAHGGHRYQRHDAFSFDARTGAVRRWNPDVTGAVVNSVAVSPDCTTAYLGGRFTGVGGTKVHDLAAVDTAKGAVLPGFGHTTDGEVETLLLMRQGTQLLVGGAFSTVNGTTRPYYLSVDPQTGAATDYLRPRVTGRLAGSSGRSMVYNQQLAPHGDRLLIEGDFTAVGGKPRQQLAELDVAPQAVTVDSWHNYRLNHTHCAADEVFYGRAAAFSPDQQTIYLAATGFRGTSPFCDAVTAFSNTSPARVRWINKTGGDSLYSVAATATSVFVGGHERWADNPSGMNACGTGCVPRPGIGAIDATAGMATPWNPTRSRGHGADDMLLTPAGLWVASDTWFNSTKCAGRYHPGICFFHRRD